MSAETVVLHGLVQADGTLEVAGKVALTPGPVEITVRTVPSAAPGVGDWWDVLQKVRAEQAARGKTPRSAAEIDAEITAARDEWEDYQLALERLQEQCWKARQQSVPPGEQAE